MNAEAFDCGRKPHALQKRVCTSTVGAVGDVAFVGSWWTIGQRRRVAVVGSFCR